MRDALKPGDVIYASFKYGHFEGMRNERWFTDMTEELLVDLLAQVDGILLEDVWVTGDVRHERGHEKWPNFLLLKR